MKAEGNSTLVSQPEKPQHYTYLKEFRTQQCPLFLQHKCTQHRPYTCFHWHFANQRRRRPIRKRDGTFNYTPDSYCSKYDETTGNCPQGDECPLLHRNSGDTERRYHIRYYKTAICVHETDSKGICTKNGVHCAFAHGTQDLRNPTYDIREVLSLERGEIGVDTSIDGLEMSTSMEKEKILNDDPKWNDSQYVLANYKTEPCKRPPRLCRQGYACPQYHNSKDRRRNPKAFKYRSTPCPQVKQHDEWGDPAVCDNGDQCQYCHTRTEQQFYPEIYKSTKCKDMVQTGYCPRGPFCAFAHVDQEMGANKEPHLESPRSANLLASFIPTSLQESTDHSAQLSPSSHTSSSSQGATSNHNAVSMMEKKQPVTPQLQQQISINSGNSRGCVSEASPVRENFPSPRSTASSVSSVAPGSKVLSSSFSEAVGNSAPTCVPEPIGKGRCMSMIEYQRSNSVSSRSTGSTSAVFGSAPSNNEIGSGRRVRPISGDNDACSVALPAGLLDSGIGGGFSLSTSSAHSLYSNSFNPSAAGDTVESVVGNAIDDVNLGDFHYLSFDDGALDHDRGDNASVCSSLSAGLASSYMSSSFSMPVSIPGEGGRMRGSLGSLSQSPPASPVSSLPVGIPQQRMMSVFPNPNQSRFSSLGTDLNPLISPRSSQQQQHLLTQAPLSNNSISAGSNGSLNNNTHLLTNGVMTNMPMGMCDSNGGGVITHKQREDMSAYSKYQQEEVRVWKREAEEAVRRFQKAEEEKLALMKQRDDALEQAIRFQSELEYVSSHSRLNQRELSSASLPQLTGLQRQLCMELEQVQQVINNRSSQPSLLSSECMVCQEPISAANRAPYSCNHLLLCDKCNSNPSIHCSVCRQSLPSNQCHSNLNSGLLSNPALSQLN